MSDDQIRLLWQYAKEIWRTFEIPDDDVRRAIKLDVWRRVLGDCPFDATRDAMLVTASAQFAPQPGVWREMLTGEAFWSADPEQRSRDREQQARVDAAVNVRRVAQGLDPVCRPLPLRSRLAAEAAEADVLESARRAAIGDGR